MILKVLASYPQLLIIRKHLSALKLDTWTRDLSKKTKRGTARVITQLHPWLINERASGEGVFRLLIRTALAKT
jgi:hypothetical protein